MKFRRKASRQPTEAADTEPTDADLGTEADEDDAAGGADDTPAGDADAASGDDTEAATGTGPRDVDETDEAEREELVDLGSLLVGPIPGFELRLQVEESSQQVQSCQLVSQEGAIDVRAFAAPRNGDLWEQVRPDIIADHERRGGSATEHDGPFGPELRCQLPVQRKDGTKAVQPTRVIGINGPRWMLRVTMLGQPALEPDDAGAFDTALDRIVVDRGSHAMAPGDALPLRLPDSAKRLG